MIWGTNNTTIASALLLLKVDRKHRDAFVCYGHKLWGYYILEAKNVVVPFPRLRLVDLLTRARVRTIDVSSQSDTGRPHLVHNEIFAYTQSH